MFLKVGGRREKLSWRGLSGVIATLNRTLASSLSLPHYYFENSFVRQPSNLDLNLEVRYERLNTGRGNTIQDTWSESYLEKVKGFANDRNFPRSTRLRRFQKRISEAHRVIYLYR